MSIEEPHFDKVVGLMVSTAKDAVPGAPRKAIELMLLAAVSYCIHDLKMTTKEACDTIDVCLGALFEQIGP